MSPGGNAGDYSWDNPKLREWATVIFGAAILTVSLVLIVAAFVAIDDAAQDASEQRMDIILVTLGLVGTVTGYFFGRVPAENRARTAEGQVAEATKSAKQSAVNLEIAQGEKALLRGKVDDALDTLTQVQESLDQTTDSGGVPNMPAFGPRPAGSGGAASAPDLGVLRAQTQLESLRGRLSK